MDDDDGKLKKRSAARHAGKLNLFGPEARGRQREIILSVKNVARANNDRPLISPTFYLKSTGKTSLVSLGFTTWVPQGFFLAHVVALH